MVEERANSDVAQPAADNQRVKNGLVVASCQCRKYETVREASEDTEETKVRRQDMSERRLAGWMLREGSKQATVQQQLKTEHFRMCASLLNLPTRSTLLGRSLSHSSLCSTVVVVEQRTSL